MLIEQMEIDWDEPLPTAAEIKFGELFTSANRIYMRVKPVSFLLNSTLIQENINAGKVFCVDVEKGTLHIKPGNLPVEKVTAKLQWRK